MKVSFNTVNYYSRPSFNATQRPKKDVVVTPPTFEQEREAKTRKTISELFCTTLAVACLYLYAKATWFK